MAYSEQELIDVRKDEQLDLESLRQYLKNILKLETSKPYRDTLWNNSTKLIRETKHNNINTVQLTQAK